MIEGEEPLDADTETREAISGYRDAMTYVLQLATATPMPGLDDDPCEVAQPTLPGLGVI